MSLRTLKWFTILLPPLVIGGFEMIRHELLLRYLSMEAGNLYIILLTFVLSVLFANWMFRNIETMNVSLSQEQAKRAVYEERERLARELHDNIAQNLFFLNVQLKKGKTEEAHSAVAEIDHHLRQAIFNLRTMPEDGVSFRDRVHEWVQQWETMTGVDVAIRMEGGRVELTPTEQVQLFSILQEAFTNIRKHSQASSAELSLSEEPDGWVLAIRDDGVGLRPGESGPNRYGVSMMRKRAAELGASFELRTGPEGRGTEVLVRGSRKPGVPAKPEGGMDR